ncbi:MAG TPA: hypothetical protein VHJ40_04705 [Actinomycetota bacterium]|nr:hypothetical protein [Actinomycetota bacterium]
MKFKIPPTVVALALCVALGLSVVSCQPSDSAKRLARIETTVEGVPEIVTRVDALEGKERGVEGQVASLGQTLAGLNDELSTLEKDLEATRGAEGTLRKKVDALSSQVGSFAGRIASVEQKISLLETRYNDHLRKYHSGG